MKYAYLVNDAMDSFNIIRNRINIGDNIQSIAVKLFYEKMGVDEKQIVRVGYFNSDKVASPCWLIVQGHFGKMQKKFMNNEKIYPIFIGYGLYESVLSMKEVEYYKRYEPILCRDEFTRNVLRSYGIKAYISGCLTIFISKDDLKEKEKALNYEKADKKYYFVDIPEETLKIIPSDIRDNAIICTQNISIDEKTMNINWDSFAVKRLREYRNNAKMIITTKLHCMCPAVGMDIPTIALGNNFSYRYSFCDAFITCYNTDEINKIDWMMTKNLTDITIVKNALLKIGKSFLEGKVDIDEIEKVDLFYEKRKRWTYCQEMKETIRNIWGGETEKKYMLWGASAGGNTVYNCIKELYPHAEMLEIIDSYATGLWEGKKIKSPEVAIKEHPNCLIIISTLSGKECALKMMNSLGKKNGKDYIVLHENISYKKKGNA